MDYARKHIVVGWWSIAVFAMLGLTLEALHAFKIRAYLDVSNETRRLMWTLAHAHGTLIGVIQVVFGIVLRAPVKIPPNQLRWISSSLIGAMILLPGGFFLSGFGFYSGDPGIGAVLIPFGAALLIAAVIGIARACARAV